MILTLILLPFIGSIISACLPANVHRYEAWLAGALTLSGLLITILLFSQVGDGQIVRWHVEWMPNFGLDFVLRMDGLAWLFTMLIQGIGLLVIVYARYYMSPKDPVPRFFSFLLAFMGSMLGVVLSGNLIQLVVFWELTSLTSFLLIAYWQHRLDARRGARMAFTVTAAGGLCLLAGVLILGRIAGSYDLDVVLAAGDQIRAHDAYLPALILVALGALTKSAQFPFHFWLPHAMAAPTPVSAFLHSATMVKAGIFLLMRLSPALSGTPEWFYIIAGAGACTLLLGSFCAIFQHDLKGLLAYSTISHLGLITLLLGLGTPMAMVAAIFHTLNHAIFKCSLFMAAGIIDHETGSRDIRQLSGLYRVLPITATLAIVATAAMAGVPLLNGFISKEMFFAETVLVSGDSNDWTLSIAALLMAIFSVAYSLRFISIFTGKLSEDLPKTPHEPPHWMRFPVEFLVFLCLVVGIVPGPTAGFLLNNAVTSVLGSSTPEYKLSLWHGINLPLMMSLIALLIGTVVYIVLRRYFGLRQASKVPVLHRINGAGIFDKVLQRMTRISTGILSLLGARHLQSQLLVIMLALIATPLVLLELPPLLASLSTSDFDWAFAVLWLIGGACAVLAAWQAKYHRLAALTLIGGAGLATSMTFLWLSAPDLALTQLAVETVTMLLILLGLRWLPPRIIPKEIGFIIHRRVWLHRSRDLVVAIVAGLTIALISYAVLISPPLDNSISDFFILRALPEGGGTNVVNVLLVDFRAFDTLGEISVLAIVALTVYALLRRFRPAPESIKLPAQQTSPVDPAVRQTPAQQANKGFLMVPAVYLRFMLPFMCLIAFYFFLRGHNEPGGGFVAGLTFSIAIIVQYMLGGTAWVENRLHLQPHRWIFWGLLIATGIGLGALLLGFPFLTSHTAHVYLPVIGEIHIPTAFVFDLGVFMVVVGATMLILVALSHQSVRSHRKTDVNEPVAIDVSAAEATAVIPKGGAA